MTPLFTSALLRTQSDERLMRLVREGNELAFEAIVDRYRRPLQRYCERALPASRAEDVVQQVLTKAWCALRDGTEVRSLRPWLYRIAATTAFETARAPGYDYDEMRRSLQAPAGPDAELEQQAVIRRTLAGLAALPAAQREALLRDAFEGQSRAQIAEALGVTEGAVRQLLHRARASLRAAATAITPLPFLSWLTAAGSAPAAGGAVEGGAAGAIGISGIAKVSAVMATAGVVVSGSAGIHNARLDESRKAKTHAATPAARRQPAVKVSRAAPVALLERAPREPQPSEHRASGRQGNAQPERQSGDRSSGGRGGSDQSDQPDQRSDQAQAEPDQPPPEEHPQAPQQPEGDGGGGGGASAPEQSGSGDGGD